MRRWKAALLSTAIVMTGTCVSWYALLNDEARSSVSTTLKQIGHSAKSIRDAIVSQGDNNQNAGPVFEDDVMEQWSAIGY